MLFHRDNIPTIPFPDTWQLVGGGIEQGETPLQGLKRELTEEASFVPKDIRFVGTVQRETGITNLYICFVTDEEAAQFKHGPGEGQEIGFFTIEEALKLNLTPSLQDRLDKNLPEIERAMKERDIPKLRF